MSAILAKPEQLAAIRALLDASPRRQLYLGDEDWPALLAAGSVYVWVDGDGLRGVLACYAEQRPVSLPPAAPDRVYLRAAGFRRNVSPSIGLTELVQAYCSDHVTSPQVLIAYGGEPWLERAYVASGLTLHDQVIYFERENLARLAVELTPPAGPAALAWATPGDVTALARLDAATFDVVWHMNAQELSMLLIQGSIQMACAEDMLVGYMAFTVNGESAQLARLAVHPTWQGRGIGRQLFAQCLLNAAGQGCQRAVLNTQASNHAAQGLYRTFGFTVTGQRIGVYSLAINI